MAMSFTDRFVKVPIKVFDTEEKELTGKAEYFDSYMKLLPFEISSYKPMQDDDNDNQECVSVCLKNGDRFYVYLTMIEFEKLLNEHQK